MEPEPLCLRPEVLDLALFAKAMAEEVCRKSAESIWHEGEGSMVPTLDALVSRLAPLGITASWVKEKRRAYLQLEFPASIPEDRLKKAHEEYDSYRAEYVRKIKEQRKD